MQLYLNTGMTYDDTINELLTKYIVSEANIDDAPIGTDHTDPAADTAQSKFDTGSVDEDQEQISSGVWTADNYEVTIGGETWYVNGTFPWALIDDSDMNRESGYGKFKYISVDDSGIDIRSAQNESGLNANPKIVQDIVENIKELLESGDISVR